VKFKVLTLNFRASDATIVQYSAPWHGSKVSEANPIITLRLAAGDYTSESPTYDSFLYLPPTPNEDCEVVFMKG